MSDITSPDFRDGILLGQSALKTRDARIRALEAGLRTSQGWLSRLIELEVSGSMRDAEGEHYATVKSLLAAGQEGGK